MVIFQPTPTKCDACQTKLGDVMYDAKTQYGPWGCLCENCFTFGPGLGKLGTGLGQKYERREDGQFHKVAG